MCKSLQGGIRKSTTALFISHPVEFVVKDPIVQNWTSLQHTQATADSFATAMFLKKKRQHIIDCLFLLIHSSFGSPPYSRFDSIRNYGVDLILLGESLLWSRSPCFHEWGLLVIGNTRSIRSLQSAELWTTVHVPAVTQSARAGYGWCSVII